MADRILLNQSVDGEIYGNKKGSIRKGFESRLNKDRHSGYPDEVNWVTGKQQFVNVYVLYRM